MKIFVDDERDAPSTYLIDEQKDFVCRSVWETIQQIYECCEMFDEPIEELSLDHDAGIYHGQGGDYIEILKWMEWYQHKNNFSFVPYIHVIKFHTANPVGRNNMIAICEANGWNYEF